MSLAASSQRISFDEVLVLADEARKHFREDAVRVELERLAKATRAWLENSPKEPKDSPECFSYDFDGSIKPEQPWCETKLQSLAEVPEPYAWVLQQERQAVLRARAWEHGLLRFFDIARRQQSPVLALVPANPHRGAWGWVVAVVTHDFTGTLVRSLNKNAIAASLKFPDITSVFSLGRAGSLAGYSPNVDAGAKVRPRIVKLMRLGLVTVRADKTGYGIEVGPTAEKFLSEAYYPSVRYWSERHSKFGPL